MMLPLIVLVSLPCLLASVAAFPLADGFPNPNSSQLSQIENHSFGSLSNAALPLNISSEGIKNLQVIALNELAEVAFFAQLLANITNNVEGYQIPDATHDYILEALLAAQHQEELHALSANTALRHFGADPIMPSNYSFPVSSFDDAIRFASLFTSIVLGAQQDLARIFANNSDADLVGLMASIIGQEGEQEGFYRLLQGKLPNELPFLTTVTRGFLFTALQRVIVPGSCANPEGVNLTAYVPLELVTMPVAESSNITIKYDVGDPCATNTSLSAVYLNQQNLPLVQNVVHRSVQGNMVTAEVFFPYDEYRMNGLTVLALTNTTGPFVDATEVQNVTVFGPAFFIVN